MSETDYYVFFSYSIGIGPKTLVKLLEQFKTAEKIYNASKKELINAGFKGKNLEKYLKFKSEFDLNKILLEIKNKNIWVITYAQFPEKLKNISNPPIVLYGRGDKNLIFLKNSIGIVGSRRPTSYGVTVTESFTRDFVDVGFVIISGMAMGIDGIAHKTCLKHKGKTIAVLGSGVDLPTPGEHWGLYNEIIKNGGAVVSEFPLGMIPNKGSFPARNRIISALSDAILIPEATSDSGALITAKEAFSQGRKVFSIPGPITSSLSKGTNGLFKDGAVAVGSAEEILGELNLKSKTKNKSKIVNLKLSKEEKLIYKVLENESLAIDIISRKTKIPIGKIMVILSEMELRAILKNVDGEWKIGA